MDWIICPSCEEEFKIITDSTTALVYCPFCSEELVIKDFYDEDEDE